ncbi:hypothetical protein H6P81_002668 [Aristolochia fimbriata]|uniref:Uncharacterized protein n=1 Tax=Aristolochia fimbriata TaxID=158543 RepID=A0AAV7FAE5_ARIFI|nr:hypothetical protein H6P81_002668 [Aristolochia fimbriata]
MNNTWAQATEITGRTSRPHDPDSTRTNDLWTMHGDMWHILLTLGWVKLISTVQGMINKCSDMKGITKSDQPLPDRVPISRGHME